MPIVLPRLPSPSGRIHLHQHRHSMTIHPVRTCPACGRSFCSHCYPLQLHTHCPEAKTHARTAASQ